MRKSAFVSVLILFSFVFSGLVNPAKALSVTMPEEWIDFQNCESAELTEMCVESFLVDVDQDGIWEDPAETLSIHAYLFDIQPDNTASLAIYIRNNNNQELSPTLPTGTNIFISLNTRDWKPRSQAFSTSKVNSFLQVQNEGNWITQAEVSTSSMAFATDCTDEGCSNPTNRIDYVSKADFILFNLGEQTAYDTLFNGMYISSNATSTNWPSYDSTTMSWNVETSGPALTDGGDENIAYLNAFFPDTAIISAYGADPESMVGVFKVLRKDGNKTVEQEVNITRVTEPVSGILLEIPAYSFASNDVVEAPLSGIAKKFAPLTSNKYTSPQHKIKPKVKLMSAPTLFSATKSGTSATLKGSTLSGAKSYQGVCIKGSKIKYGTSNNPNLKVKNLTKGNWNCRIRGVKKIGGMWSNQLKVKIS